MAAFTATPFRGLGLPAVTSGSTFRATHRLPQSSNPDIPAIVVQSSMLSLVFPKRNPTSQGNGLSRDLASAGSTGVDTPIATTSLSRRGPEGEATLQPSVESLQPSRDIRFAPGSLKGEKILGSFCRWVLESRGVRFRGYRPTALKVPHPHEVPEVGSLVIDS